MTKIELFIKDLTEYIESSESTNLYGGNSGESQIRRENLQLYLEKMQKLNPSFLLLGEAPGYRGCRLTGIPFSSERILEKTDFFRNQGFKYLNEKQSF